MADLGPVTTALEREVQGELRRRGIVVWLDRDESYTEYVDSLLVRWAAAGFPYPVVAFRGSFLEIMLALENLATGLDPTPVLIHMPGFTEDAMRATPILEIYKAGFRFRRALDTLVRDAATGHVAPAEVSAFLDTGPPTLASADAWLAKHTSAAREGLSAILDHTSPEVVTNELLVRDTFLGVHLHGDRPESVTALRAYFARHLGLDDSWLEFIRANDPRSDELDVLVEGLASWLLCMEYVHDLRREPHLGVLRPLRAMPKPTVAICLKLVAGLREQHPDRYETLADQVETHLQQELREIQPEDLGRIDTFRTEESRMLDAAVQALVRGEWERVREWTTARRSQDAFWLRRDQRRRIAWSLVDDAAALGCLIATCPRPFEGAKDLHEAISRYSDVAFNVDRAHRRFEQQRNRQLQPQLPHFAGLKEAVGVLHGRYRVWADTLARDFSALCRDKGPLPDRDRRQRAVYEQVVHPLVQGGEKVAVLMVDGLRYEMAVDLMEELAAEGAKTRITARLAELPTVTAVGMNALAPVERNERLVLAGNAGFKGFKTGEFTVDGPDDRARAMGVRSTGEPALSLDLAEISDLDSTTLGRKVAQKSLIVVHSHEIDDAGEAGVGLPTFEGIVAQVKAAWLRLKAAKVGKFVITSDHGFLLLDETTAVRPYGKKTDPLSRYVLSAERRIEPGTLTVSLTELGYEGRDGYLLFPEDTAVFDTGGKRPSFVHGGNSPQERIIPVLTVSGAAVQADLGAYLVEARKSEDALGFQRVRARLLYDAASASGLPFERSTPIELVIRAAGRADVHVVVRGVAGPGREKAGRLLVPVGEDWTEVFLTIEGPQDEQVRLELLHLDAVERVAPGQVEGWFVVEGKTGAGQGHPLVPTAHTADWLGSLPDDGTRQVFSHLERHGVVTETEAVQMLGSPRAFRRFSGRFEEFLVCTPLRVRIEVTPEGKRYLKEGRGA